MSAAAPTSRLPRGVWASLAALLVALTVVYVGHPDGRFTRGGRAHGDGVYYYVYLRSLVHDRDVDFENDYRLLGNPHHRPVGAHGLRENRFAIGAGLLWLPTYAVAHAVVAVAGDEPHDGTGAWTQRITLYASVLHAVVAAVAIVLLARRYVADWIACVAAVATVVATPLWWYAVYQPSWPHAASAAVVACFVLLWDRGREARTLRGYAGLGALLGLVMLVRAQDCVFALLLVPELVTRLRGAKSPVLRDAAVFAVTVMLAFSPQMLAWWAIYGSPLTIPQGEGFMLWGASKPGFTLFSSRNGLLAWSPIVSLALLGVGLLALRRGPGRALAGMLLLVFAAEAYILGSTRDWWGGWAFGGRRWLGCSVIFGLGLAVLIDRVHAWTLRHSRVVLAALPVAAVSLFALGNLSLVHDYLYAEVRRGESQPMRGASERAVVRGVAAVYDTLGHPGAAPASWWFAWRAGVAPERYDAVSGVELVSPMARPGDPHVIWLDDPRFGMAGFGPRSEHAGQRASLVEGTAARFVLPLRDGQRLAARVKLAAIRDAATLRITVGGVEVFAAEVTAGWHFYDFEIPAQALSAGFNWADATQSSAIAWGSLQLWPNDKRPVMPAAVDASRD